MERRPDPSSQPARAAGVVRLLGGAALAGLGALVLVGGLLSVLGPAGPAAQGSMAVAASSAPSPTASGSPAGNATRAPATSPPGSPGPSPSGDPVLVGAGDIARCDSDADAATASLVDGIAGIVFVLGDAAYERGSAAELQDCYGPTWGRFLDRTRFAAIGNHDVLTEDGAPFRAYFGDAAGPGGVAWFSADLGAWHVIVLDSNCAAPDNPCDAGSEQLRWLRADLAASTARCTLALWHHPRFSSGVHGDDTGVAPFWDALYAAGADLVLNGHDHDYERFAPQDPRGSVDRARGITEMVVGTGGADLRDFATPAVHAIVRSNLAHGVVELTLHPAGWEYRFVSTDGSFSDQGTGTCH